MNPEKKPADVIDQTLEELLGSKVEKPDAEQQSIEGKSAQQASAPIYLPNPINYIAEPSAVSSERARKQNTSWIAATPKEIKRRLPHLITGSVLCFISTFILGFLVADPSVNQYISRIAIDNWRVILFPAQLFWMFCLFGISRAAFAKYGSYPLHPFVIVLLATISWGTFPTFYKYIELSPSAISILLDPLFSVWLICQLTWPFLLSNYLQAKESKDAKPNIIQSLIVASATNAYLLSSPLWREITVFNVMYVGLAVQCQIYFCFLWAVSQIWCIAYFCSKFNSTTANSRVQAATSKKVEADGDLVIVYKAFAAIERWRDQQQKALKKEMRTILWMSIPIILICYGSGLFLVSKVGGVKNMLTMVLGKDAVKNDIDETEVATAVSKALKQDEADKAGVIVAGKTSQAKSSAGPASVIDLSPEFSAGANFSFVVLMSLLAGAGVFTAVIIVLSQPTHVGLSPRGWRFLWRRGVSGNGEYVAWDQLQKINITRPKGKTSPLDELLCFKMRSGKVHKIKMGSIESVDDREQLLKAIEKWAPNVERDASVIQALTPATDSSYTELWLQALSAPPQRERLKPLSANMILQDGKYKVSKQLGTGGQGQAYLATDTETNEGIVLKEFILPVYVDVNVRRASLEQFENEARLLRQINHPRIVKLIDFFVEDHRTYLVLEHIKGGSLRELVKSKGKLDQGQVASLAKQMCNILSYLHNLNPPIIHRDFTPDNLILNFDGTLKLIDFNVAKQVLESTTSGTVVGKHAYLPPEQFRGMPECSSDIYAMGATLHFLLTGSDPEPIATSHPKRLDESISDRLNTIVERATALNTAKRYAKAEELLADLESFT